MSSRLPISLGDGSSTKSSTVENVVAIHKKIATADGTVWRRHQTNAVEVRSQAVMCCEKTETRHSLTAWPVRDGVWHTPTDRATTLPKEQESIPPRTLFHSFPRVGLADIEAALVRYASSHFGYRKAFLRQIKFSYIQTEGIYFYKLETFGEMRTKIPTSTPYNGCAIDSDRNGSAPGIWDIPVHPHTPFKDSERKVTIPHTEYVTRCLTCRGKGYVKCKKCSGSGVMFCEVCRNNGPLMLQGERCYYCQNWGNGGLLVSCDGCGGKRELNCNACKSRKLMKHCETLCITWVTEVSEVSHKETNVPFLKLKSVMGNTLICEEREKLQPLKFDAEPSIYLISCNLLRQHLGAFPFILKQRHSLRIVPTITVSYTWRGRTGEFYLYGIENKVYFKNYPAKWNSCILL